MNRYHVTEVYSYPAKIILPNLKERIIRKTAIKVREFDMVFSNTQNDCMYQIYSYIANSCLRTAVGCNSGFYLSKLVT
jgi:hypothetical protein